MKKVIIEINDEAYESICEVMEMTDKMRREDSLAAHIYVSIYNGTLISDDETEGKAVVINTDKMFKIKETEEDGFVEKQELIDGARK